MRFPRRLHHAVALAVALGAGGGILALLPWGVRFEESVGLSWLFHVRGSVAPPPQVVIVSIDNRSSTAFGFKYKAKDWDRRIYAQLINGLTQAGASVVVLDLAFREARPEQDKVLAEAIRRAGNVLLLQHLEKKELQLDEDVNPDAKMVLYELIPPTRALSAFAVASGPFTLPKVPRQVAQFWTFDENAGDAPSLPLLVLLHHAASDYRRLAQRVVQLFPDLADQSMVPTNALVKSPAATGSVSWLHALFRDHPSVFERLKADVSRDSGGLQSRLMAHGPLAAPLLEALRPPSSRYLNFYGPSQTITTLSYVDALAALSGKRKVDIPFDLQGRAIFVGLSSPVQWQQDDEFITVFSDDETGLDLSGIEVLATAFANLLDDSALRAPLLPTRALLVLGWGLVIGFLSRLFTPGVAFVALIFASIAYALVAVAVFRLAYVWLPLMIPLVVQVPLALFATTAIHYRDAKQDQGRIREAFRHYLPELVVDRLVHEGFHPTQDPENVFGICLYTDAEQYTKLAEQMTPDALTVFMNDYFELIFDPVETHDGIISDVVGDAMMAIWAARKGQRTAREAACRAAVEIQRAVSARAITPGRPVLPTRIGLHCGTVALGNVGAGEHFEYRAVGDVVNTASRLEQLNKRLGTRILASGEMIDGLDGLLTRYLGRFVLSGKSNSIPVYELLDLVAPEEHPDGSIQIDGHCSDSERR